MLNSVDDAKDYLEQIYKVELAVVISRIPDITRLTRRVEYELRHAITGLEGVSKPLKYRKYLSDLSNLTVTDYLKMFDSKEQSDEFMFIGNAAIKLKRSEKMIRNYINTGKLLATKDRAGKTIIYKSSVEAFNKAR
jgi:hypothetical protein